MPKSKYQQKAQNSIKKKQSKGGPHYYDENIKKKKNSGIAVFAIFVLVIVGGIAIVGSLLNNNNEPTDADINPYYTENTGNTVNEGADSSGYKSPLSITTLSGETINLADHAGKVVVLYFHYLSCTYCHYHSPALEAASHNFGSDELLVISISVASEDTPASLTNWASENGYTFKLVKDTDYSLSSQFGAQYTPHTVYLAPDGDSSTTHTGAQSEAEITATITGLLD
ncbi:MAG: peroxiredoxin family protein [Promethearchaeota archaeon]